MTSTPTAVLVEEKCGAKGKLSSEHDYIVEGDLTGRQVHQHVIISVFNIVTFSVLLFIIYLFPFHFFFFLITYIQILQLSIWIYILGVLRII